MKLIKQLLIVVMILTALFVGSQYHWGGSVANSYAAVEDLPRTDDGLVDYLEVVNQRAGSGATIDNNVVVDLVQIFGIEGHLPSEVTDDFLSLLGNPDVPADAAYQDPVKFAEENDPQFDRPQFLDQTYDRLFEPWTAEELPLMARWLAQQQSNLDQLIRASNKPRYFHPLCSPNGDLIGALLPYAQLTREAARALNMRAMHEIGNHNLACALDNMAAARRLGHKLEQGTTLVERLVGYAVIGITSQSEQILLNELVAGVDLSAAKIDQYRQVIRETAQLESLGRCVADGEVFMMRDVIQRFERGKDKGTDYLNGTSGVPLSLLGPWTNWALAAEECDKSYQQLGKIMDGDSFLDRQAAMEQFESGIESFQQETRTAKFYLKLLAGANMRGKMVGHVLTGMLTPAMSNVDEARTRTLMSSQIADLGFALEQFRRQRGEFPATLDELQPEFASEIPMDEFSGRALNYRRTGNGYRLWSVGRDGVDDQLDEQGNLVERSGDDSRRSPDIVLSVEYVSDSFVK